MKKTIALLTFAAVLSGCQMMPGQSKPTDIENTDFTSMSCEDIKAVFDGYNSSMEIAETGSSVLSIVGMGAATEQAKLIAHQAYDKAATVARPIIKIKQCKFTI
ncbi:lipoprotein [Photobacterium damselae]|uniref:lipoprotein n=1 Tax=Photobacterium damselae TaxID=38293 RepID=UPI00165D78A8|nr:lipoprotein [Photobacterium damselae]